MPKTTVIVQPGLFSGPPQTRRFRQLLRKAGYDIARDASKADIIIGHSAGCFDLPSAPTHQKLMLIDPPYWPGKTVRQRARARMRSNFRFRSYGYSTRWWLVRNLWGAYYALFDVRRTRDIMTKVEAYDLDQIISNHQAILVHNTDDDWLTPDLDDLERRHAGLNVVHLPGDHEDCLHNPQPYVALLERLL